MKRLVERQTKRIFVLEEQLESGDVGVRRAPRSTQRCRQGRKRAAGRLCSDPPFHPLCIVVRQIRPPVMRSSSMWRKLPSWCAEQAASTVVSRATRDGSGSGHNLTPLAGPFSPSPSHVGISNRVPACGEHTGPGIGMDTYACLSWAHRSHLFQRFHSFHPPGPGRAERTDAKGAGARKAHPLRAPGQHGALWPVALCH